MKTKTYLGLSIAAIFALMISCNSGSTTKNNSQTDDTEMDGTKDQTNKKSKYTIPVADIKLMINKYRMERQEIINRNPDLKKLYGDDFMDSRCAWFSIDEIKKFLAEVERKNPKTKLTGLRMYYTVYPTKQEGESEYLSSIPAQDRNHSSLLLIPTYYDERSQTHVDFAPEDEKIGESHSTGTGEKAARSASADAASQPALNHGGLCPPNCPNALPSSYLSN